MVKSEEKKNQKLFNVFIIMYNLKGKNNYILPMYVTRTIMNTSSGSTCGKICPSVFGQNGYYNLGQSFSVGGNFHPGDTWQTLVTFLVVWGMTRKTSLASSGDRPRVLLTILKCTREAHKTKNYSTKMSVLQRLRKHGRGVLHIG